MKILICDDEENYLNVLTSDIQKDIEKVNIIRSLKQERVRMRA